MIRVSAISTETSNRDSIEVALSLGTQGFIHIVGYYQSGYIVADQPLDIDSVDDVDSIMSMVEHSEEGTIVLDSGIEVWVIV